MKRIAFLLGLLVIIPVFYACSWSGMINRMMPSDSRPQGIVFDNDVLSDAEFEQTAELLEANFQGTFSHIERFRDAGIRSYKGPETCLQCHEKIQVVNAYTQEQETVDLMDNLTSSAHYTFFTKKHPDVYGFNGELADNFPMGKIDRPCPKPGSFAMTAWAEIVLTEAGDTLSEGCGQCHIGGQVQTPLGEMMPFYSTTQSEKDAIDCLICHSNSYDMNKKQVVQEANVGLRWGQDRSLRAALAVQTPKSEACLRCHQHNFGGDIYVDEADPNFMQSLTNLGQERPRVTHPGSKRGTPFSPSWDVHAASGINCIECHTTQGHYIAKGTHTTTMMANDLPGVEVSCESCHTAEPHYDDAYNMHVQSIACQTCHIPNLHPDNVTRRDFSIPEYEEHPGIWIYSDIEKETEPGKGIEYVWWNGDATFMGNPIGDNPNGENLYNFYKPSEVWPEFADYDYEKWYEEVMRPIAQKKPSKIYAMKVFNGRQHIDLKNIGPFGGMYIPYNLPTYYKNGNPELAAKVEMQKPMMKKMYGLMFDQYLMNDFIEYMDDGSGDYLPGWDTSAYDDVASMTNGKVDARWLPVHASMEISHSIRLDGALSCEQCHSPNGVMDFHKLGYTAEEIEELRSER